MQKYFRNQVTDHYSVDFLGNWRVFWFQLLFRMCLPCSLHHETSRSSLPFELTDLWSPFILLAWFAAGSLLGVKTPHNDLGIDYKLTTDSDKILTFSLERIFVFVLSLGVKTELKNPVTGIACTASFERDYFDMLKSLWFASWVRLFSSFKRIW